MSIEDTLSAHYRSVEVDEAARRRLQSLIIELSEQSEPPPSSARVRVGMMALVVAACVVATLAAGVLWVRHGPQARRSVAATTLPQRSGRTQNAGLISVVNARGVSGLIRQTDLDAVLDRAGSDTSSARADLARRKITVVLPLLDANGSRVIGEWHAAGRSVLAVFCPHRDGVAFSVPAAGRTGDLTPVQAARDVTKDLSLAGFGTDDAVWTVRSLSATSATLTTATTTLHAHAQADGTWVITSGQRCIT